ncbi:hypothetical protein KQX54_018113 [Cotesia glomerata]|uniref:Uncharacterized protein n=1 Tax=Cotesia glomerata TaxID=32391 RepID=A0AAV7IGN1_COTGL|nr:hypothetical protein KQX54_018113 [Cotesia glomerata]
MLIGTTIVQILQILPPTLDVLIHNLSLEGVRKPPLSCEYHHLRLGGQHQPMIVKPCVDGGRNKLHQSLRFAFVPRKY